LPAISRGELQADVHNRSGVCKPHQKKSLAVASSCEQQRRGHGWGELLSVTLPKLATGHSLADRDQQIGHAERLWQ
jgi:hypothetical protein